MSAVPIVAVVGLEDGPEACAGPGLLAALDAVRCARLAVPCRSAETGALRARGVDATAPVGDPRDDEAGFVERVAELVRVRRVNVLLAGAPHVAFALAAHARTFERAGARQIAAEPDQLARLRTEGLEAVCNEAGLRAVPTFALPEQPTAFTFSAITSWPIALLADDGARRRAVDAYDAVRASRALRLRGAKRVVVASPRWRNLIEVALVVARDGTLLGSCSVRVLEDDERLRPWLAVTIDDEAARGFAHALAVRSGLVGPATIALQAGDGVHAALDAQACFPVWIEAALREGPNLVQLAVEVALGARARPAGNVPAGTLFSQTAQDLVLDPRSSAAAPAK